MLERLFNILKRDGASLAAPAPSAEAPAPVVKDGASLAAPALSAMPGGIRSSGGVSNLAQLRFANEKLLNLYRGWVYACINKRARAKVRLIRKFYYEGERAGDLIELPSDYWAYDLFTHPNRAVKHMTRSDIFGGQSQWMDLRGKSYIWTPTNGYRSPVQMWLLPVNQVEPKSDGTRFISHYLWSQDGGRPIRIPQEEMLFMRTPGPFATMWSQTMEGFSPAMASIDSIQISQEMKAHLRDALVNRMMPPWFVRMGGEPDPVKAALFREMMRESFQGHDNTEPMGFLFGDWDIKEVELYKNEASLAGIDEPNFKEICAVFGVPPGSLTNDYDNFATAETHEKSFLQDRIEPEADYEDEVWTAHLRQWDPRVIVRHVPGVYRTPEELRAEDGWAIANGLRTRGDVARSRGYEEIGDDQAPNDYLIASNLIPVARAMEGGIASMSTTAQLAARVLAEEQARQADDTTRGMEGGDRTEPPFVERADETWSERELYLEWKQYDRISRRYEPEIRSAVSAFFEALRDEVLSNVAKSTPRLLAKTMPRRRLKADSSSGLGLFDMEKARQVLAAKVSSHVADLIIAQMKAATERVGTSWDDVESEFDRTIRDSLDASIDKISSSLDTVKEELRKLIRNHSDASAEELRDAITTKFDTLSASRAATIARTSTTFATGSAQRSTWDALEVESVWLAQPGARTTHRIANGSRPGPDGLFRVGADTMTHPGAGELAEENVNCRCTLRPRRKKQA